MKPIYALSIKQPWAWLICKGYKCIENRNWKLPERMVGERIYIHAGKNKDTIWNDAVLKMSSNWDVLNKALIYMNAPSLGAIIGEVTIKYCTDRSNSPWFIGKYGFVLSEPVLYDKPIPCKGKLGFFEPELLEAAR